MTKIEKIKQWQLNNPEKVKSYIKKCLDKNANKYKENALNKRINFSEEERQEYNKKCRERRQKRMLNPEARKKASLVEKNYREKNREENKKRRNERLKKKYKENVEYRLEILLRVGFLKALKRKKGIKEKSIMSIIGCTQHFLKEYIEKQFKPEMDWENHGIVWEIDHIKPIDSFDLTKLEDQLICFNYINLQPLFKTTEIAISFGYINEIGNQNKSNKIL